VTSGGVARRALATGLLLGVMALCQGCITTTVGTDTASPACADRVLDLRQPPTRAGLEMRDGRAWTSWACDKGFQSRIHLPGGKSTTMLSRLVAVNSYGAAEPDIGEPTTIDVHSTALSIDAGASLAGQVASDLDIDASELETWRVRAETSTTTDVIKTSFMRSQVSEVLTELRVVHHPHADTTYVHLIMSW